MSRNMFGLYSPVRRRLAERDTADDFDIEANKLNEILGVGAVVEGEDDDLDPPHPDDPDPPDGWSPTPHTPHLDPGVVDVALVPVDQTPRPELVTDMPANVLVVRDVRRDLELQAIQAALAPLLVQADAFVVTDAASCVAGEVLFDQLRRGEQQIHDNCDPDCGRAHVVWQGLTAQRRLALEVITPRRERINTTVATWKAAERAREAAADRERERLAQLEQRQEAERNAKVAERQGDAQTATQIRQEAATAPPPALPATRSAVPNTGLTTGRRLQQCQVDDLPALLKAIGDRTLKEFDAALLAALQPLLNAQARALAKAPAEFATRYPGCRVHVVPRLAGR